MGCLTWILLVILELVGIIYLPTWLWIVLTIVMLLCSIETN